MPIDAALFKEALTYFPSGVVIVTTHDAEGKPRGFTASSFASVSLDPPLVLVCLANNAECYDAFLKANRFAISILKAEHEGVAKRFATRGIDKFGGGDLVEGPGGLVLVKNALETLVCTRAHEYPAGDHVILVGHVEEIGLADEGDAMVHFRRRFTRQAGKADAAA